MTAAPRSLRWAVVTAFAAAACAERPRPNVVVVLSDTHRADYVGAARNPGELTPFLAHLARDGRQYARAYTPVPASAPAYATLFTGMLPREHGLVANTQPLRPSLPVLAEAFEASRYETAAFVANPFCGSGFGFNRGFQTFWDDVAAGGTAGFRVTDAALEWLSRQGDRPFFVFLAYMDAHVPFLAEREPDLLVSVNGEPCCVVRADGGHREARVKLALRPGVNEVTLRVLVDGAVALPADSPSALSLINLSFSDESVSLLSGVDAPNPDAYRRIPNRLSLRVRNARPSSATVEMSFGGTMTYTGSQHRRYYRAGVREFDAQFGRLMNGLRQRGLYDETVVVFLSDHGEMLGEHDAWGHILEIHEETLRIPLIVKAPSVPGGSFEDGAVDLRDVHGALHRLAAGGRWSLQPRDEREVRVAASFPDAPEPRRIALFRERWKATSTTASDAIQVFDLASDPRELRDLSQTPGARALIQELWPTFVSEKQAIRSLSLPAPLDDSRRELLKALGYASAPPPTGRR